MPRKEGEMRWWNFMLLCRPPIPPRDSPFVAGRCAAACYYHNPHLMMLPSSGPSPPSGLWVWGISVLSSLKPLLHRQVFRFPLHFSCRSLWCCSTWWPAPGNMHTERVSSGGWHCLQGIILRLYGQSVTLNDTNTGEEKSQKRNVATWRVKFRVITTATSIDCGSLHGTGLFRRFIIGIGHRSGQV